MFGCRSLHLFLYASRWIASEDHPVCKHNRASCLVSVVTSCPWDRFQLGPVIGWPLPLILFHLCPYTSYRQAKFWVKSLQVGCFLYYYTGSLAGLQEVACSASQSPTIRGIRQSHSHRLFGYSSRPMFVAILNMTPPHPCSPPFSILSPLFSLHRIPLLCSSPLSSPTSSLPPSVTDHSFNYISEEDSSIPPWAVLVFGFVGSLNCNVVILYFLANFYV